MPTISFIVPGIPVAKGRPRFTRSGHCFTPEKTRSCEGALKYFFLKAVGTVWQPLTCPLSISIVAMFPMPKSSTKKDRERRTRPKTTKPDLDNIIKSLDGLNGVAWRDDSQIVCIKHAAKIETIEPPGLAIKIEWETHEKEKDAYELAGEKF